MEKQGCLALLAFLACVCVAYGFFYVTFPAKKQPLVVANWNRPLLDRLPIGPCGESYHPNQTVYRFDTDKTEAGESRNADLASWEIAKEKG